MAGHERVLGGIVEVRKEEEGEPVRRLRRFQLRYALPWLSLGLVGLATAGGAVLGATMDASRTVPPAVPVRPVFPPTAFGGYAVMGPVTQVGATWHVPVVADTSHIGHASTWIGVESRSGDFIQIGTIEDQLAEGSPSLYVAFWSDVGLGFHPRPLGLVGPGDDIQAEMSQIPGGWLLHLHDRTNGLDSTFQSNYGANDAFVFAEWTQEDPAIGTSPAIDLPYPELSDVTFSDLQENGRHPLITFADGRSLASPNGVYLVPTRMADDGFTVRRASLLQAQYLADAAPLSLALVRLEAALTQPGSTTSIEAARSFVASLQIFRKRVVGQAWPPEIRAPLKAELSDQSELITLLQAWLADPSRSESQAVRIISTPHGRDPRAARRVRALLGLPPH